MKTFKLLAALSVVALAAGCQHSQRSATMSRDQSDNEVSLQATSTDTNISVYSDGRTAQLRDTTSKSDAQGAATVDRSGGEVSGSVNSGDKTAVPANANTAGSKPADNTGKNARDRNDQTLTPGDQGSSSGDIDLTRRIRKQIVQQDGLSANAKNVKIITVNGKVTLRGPVKTQNEKDTISMLAQAIAGSDAIDNQLEVKGTNQ
jgi:hyperosmotically inducible periplasmic protein